MRAKVQKPSKQTRYIQRLFEANADTIKDTPDLVSAATVILDYIHPSHYDVQELIENFENHAEVLLTGLTLVDQFKDWPGLEEIRSFIKDKKWWKRRQVIQQEPSPPPRRAAPGRRRVFSEEHSVEPNTPKDDSETANASQDELTAETPIEYPRTAKKGTSVLRPRYSMSRTPGTPTRQVDQESEPSSTDMHPHSGPITDAEEELQLLQLPADVSQRIQNEKKTLTRKRKFDHEPVEKVFKRPRNTQTDEPTDFFSVKFGRGRPPLTTVMVCPTLLDSLQLPLSNDQTTTFCCTFPECTYTRVCSSSMSAKAAIDKHHRMHQSEIRDALEMLKDPFIIGGRVGGEKGNRLVRPIGGVDHLVERIEEMAKGLGGTPSKRLVV
jgi:hypothetical protein